MKVYTKSGDNGTTGLLGGGKYPKSDNIFEVLGTLDELNASLGLLYNARITEVTEPIKIIQNELFQIGAQIADKKAKDTDYKFLAQSTQNLEEIIDKLDKKLPELKNFILSTGAENAVKLHYSRAICRRLERALSKFYNSEDKAGKENVLKYINRLSDFLFVAARFVNFKLGVKEEIWNSRKT